MVSRLKLLFTAILVMQTIHYVSNQTFDNEEKYSLEKAIQIRNARLRKILEAKTSKQEALRYIRPSTRPAEILKEGTFMTIFMEYDGVPMPLYLLLIALVPLLLAKIFKQIWNLVRPKLKFRREGGGEFPFTACFHLQETLREQSLKRIARNCTSWFVHQYILAIEDETLEWNDVIESLQPKENVTKKRPWQILRLIFRLKNALDKVTHKDSEEELQIMEAKGKLPLFTGNNAKCELRKQKPDETFQFEDKIDQLASQYETLDALEKDGGVGPSQPHPVLFTVQQLMEYMTREEKLLVLHCFEKPDMEEIMIYCDIDEIRRKHREFVQAHMAAVKDMNEQRKDRLKANEEKVVETLFEEKDKLAKDIHNSNDKLLSDWAKSGSKKSKLLPPNTAEQVFDDANNPDEEEIDPNIWNIKSKDSIMRIESLIKVAEIKVKKAEAKKARLRQPTKDEQVQNVDQPPDTEDKKIDSPIQKEKVKAHKRRKTKKMDDINNEPVNDLERQDVTDTKKADENKLREADETIIKPEDQNDIIDNQAQSKEPEDKLQILSNEKISQPIRVDEGMQTHHHHHLHHTQRNSTDVPNPAENQQVSASDKEKNTWHWVENMAELRNELVNADDNEENEKSQAEEHGDKDESNIPEYPVLTLSQEKIMKTDLIFRTSDDNPKVKVYSQGRREKLDQLLGQDDLSALHASQLLGTNQRLSLEEHEKKINEAIALIENAKERRRKMRNRSLYKKDDILTVKKDDREKMQPTHKERQGSFPKNENMDEDHGMTYEDMRQPDSKRKKRDQSLPKGENLAEGKKLENTRNDGTEQPQRSRKKRATSTKKDDNYHFALIKNQEDIL